MYRGTRVIARRAASPPLAGRQRFLLFKDAFACRSLGFFFHSEVSQSRTGGGAASATATQPTASGAAAAARSAADPAGLPAAGASSLNTMKDAHEVPASNASEARSGIDGATDRSNSSSTTASERSHGSSNSVTTKDEGSAIKDSSDGTESSTNKSRIEEKNTADEDAHWWKVQWTWPRGIAALSVASFAGWFGYEFVESGYSFGKTEWVMSRKVKKLFLGEAPPPRAALDSKFEIGLPEEIQDELALYFIQLDLDKPNGFRRSDALALAEMLDFDVKNKICGNFVQKGKGRPIEERRASGCSLQELGELIEALVLDEESNQAKAAVPTEQQQQQADGESQVQQQHHREGEAPTGPTDGAPIPEGAEARVVSPAALPGEQPQERVLRLLREANTRAMPTAWTKPRMEALQEPLPSAQGQHRQREQQREPQSSELSMEDKREEAREALELRMAIVTRLLKDLKALGARRGHTEAEKQRRENLEAEVKAIKEQLRDLQYG